MYTQLIRPALFALSKNNAETAHTVALSVMKVLQSTPGLLPLVSRFCNTHKESKSITLWGITFPNRVGLAAGLDKNGELLPFWQALGFGFVEIGSVLPHFQAGNPQPRLFRLEKLEAIINRMGFNSKGAEAVAANLRRVHNRIRIPIGISVGKMKDTPNEEAVEDYLKVWERLRAFGAYAVGNVSSPNTPGLRELQGDRYLERFVQTFVGYEAVLAQKSGERPKPILIKIAPDLTEIETAQTVEAILNGGASGIIVCNTTISRPESVRTSRNASEVGGLSGSPTLPLMIEKVKYIRSLDKKIPIVAVSGIDSVARGQEALDEGADLIQVLTGFIYRGPKLIQQLQTL